MSYAFKSDLIDSNENIYSRLRGVPPNPEPQKVTLLGNKVFVDNQE